MKVGQADEEALKETRVKKMKGLISTKCKPRLFTMLLHRGMSGKLPNWPGDGHLFFLRKSWDNALMTKAQYNILNID